MNTNDLKKILSKILKVKSSDIKTDSILENFEEWDSLAMLTLMLNLSEFLKKDLPSINNLSDAITFFDLCKILKKNKILND